MTTSLPETTDPTRRLLLLDGHSLAFRAYYALPVDKFATSSGQHTNAVYGFMSMLLGLIDQEQPTHIIAAFDVGRVTFRNDKFPDYKAQRAATPEEFRGQVPLIQELLDTLGIPVVTVDNYEADDIIATLTTQAEAEGFSTLICTGDRDSLQLVTDHTTVLYPLKGVSTLHRFDPAAVEEKYGLTPAQYPDFAALRGDPSDNLPGIPKVGEKTATKWIQQYGSLANLVDHADEIRGVVGTNLRENLSQVLLNRDITAMVRTMDLDTAPSDGKLQVDINAEAVARRFDSLEFGAGLRRRLLTVWGNLPGAQSSDLDSAADQGGDAELVVTQLGADTDDLAGWLREHPGPHCLAAVGRGAPGAGDLYELALAAADGQSLWLNTELLTSTQEAQLTDYLADPQAEKRCYSAKALWHMCAGRGFTLAGIIDDGAIAAYVLAPGQRTFALEDVALSKLGVELASEDAASEQMSLLADKDTTAAQATALCQRALVTGQLLDLMRRELDEIDSLQLYTDMEVPLVSVLADMEHAGIAASRESLEELRAHFQDSQDQTQAQARELVGEQELNLGSPKQLQVVLFETLQMPKTKKTKTGFSTNAQALEQLSTTHPHPFLDLVLAYREAQKLRSTVEGLLKELDAHGRIHTTFHQTVAATGRLSSSDPNLQNIPVRTEAGRRIRAAFVVGEGYETLITADYSQIEMRVMAHLSEDEGLIAAYQAGEDLHNYVGAQVFDVGIDEVTPELRRRVKAMSYGLAYGLSAYGLANQLRIEPREADAIMQAYFRRFGGVKTYLDGVVEGARKRGFTETLFGRRRYFPELTSTNRVARENAERAALNAPIQGSAADIIKVATLRVYARFAEEGLASRLLLQVHDELVVEIAHGELDQVSEILREEMGAAISLRVPLDVSVGSGENWDAAAH